jgi:hypothetical protein
MEATQGKAARARTWPIIDDLLFLCLTVRRLRTIKRKLSGIDKVGNNARCAVAIKPSLQALLLADQVYEDSATGKKVIAGTFDALYAPASEFPTEFMRVTYAYICLCNLHGRTPLQLEYVDLSTDEVLMEYGPIFLDATDPLASVDFTVPVPPFPMPHPGYYALEVFAGNELLGRVRVCVESIEEKETDEEEGDDEAFS